MKKNGALDIICKIFSILLSIVLVPVIIVTVLVGAVTDVVQPETITEMVTEIDYSSLITENVDMTQIVGDMEIPEEKIQEVMESKLVKDIVEEYTEGMAGALTGEIDNITVDDILEIVNNNKEQITEFIKETAGEDVTQEELDQAIDSVLSDEALMESAEELVNNMPQPSELVEELPQEVTMALEILNSGIILKLLIAVVAVLALIIFVMRLWDFAGFLWLSINGIVSGVLVAVLFGAISIGKAVVLDMAENYATLVGAVINSLTQTLLTGFIALFIISAVFMTVFFVIRHLRKKKEA